MCNKKYTERMDMTEEECLSRLSECLLPWFDRVRRDRHLPWRDNPTPYHVWISEIMLQQTRIEAVRGYYQRFMEAFPDIEHLAAADEQQVLKMWEGLGYYSRARNLHRAAEICCAEYGGRMPCNYQQLRELPGIGNYTAGAVASIAFHIPAAAVDGNVLRVLARLLADREDVTKDAVKKKAETRLLQYISRERPGDFNQALMELGETICIPKGEPLCESCPLGEICLAREQGNAEAYPYRAPKKKRRQENMTILLLECRGRYAVRRRPADGLLAGLYEFPWLSGTRSREEIEMWLEEKNMPGEITELPAAKHIFSHVEWHMTGWKVRTPMEITQIGEYRTPEEIHREYPVPTAMKKYDVYIHE